MYDRTSIYPFLDNSASGTRQGHVDFNTESHELSGLVCRPIRTIRCLYDMENTPTACVFWGRMITCPERAHSLDVVMFEWRHRFLLVAPND